MNGDLDNFSLPQAIEYSGQLLLLRTDISQKTVTGCPWLKVVSGMFWFTKERCVNRRPTSSFSIVILEEFLCSKFENIIKLTLRHDSSFAGSQAGSNHKMSQHHHLPGNLSSEDQSHQSLRGHYYKFYNENGAFKEFVCFTLIGEISRHWGLSVSVNKKNTLIIIFQRFWIILF